MPSQVFLVSEVKRLLEQGAQLVDVLLQFTPVGVWTRQPGQGVT